MTSHITRFAVTLLSLAMLYGQSAANEESEFLNTLLSDTRTDALATIPPGVYQVDELVLIESSDQLLIADGVVIRPLPDFAGDELVRIESRTRTNRLTIRGLKINGLGRPIVGIRAVESFRLTLDQCEVKDCRASGIRINNAADLKLIHCDVRECGNAGTDSAAVELFADPSIDQISRSNTTWVESCTIERSDGPAFRATRLAIMWIDNCKFHGWGRRNPNSAIKSETGIVLIRCQGVRIRDPLIVNVPERLLQTDCADVVFDGQFAGTKIR